MKITEKCCYKANTWNLLPAILLTTLKKEKAFTIAFKFLCFHKGIKVTYD